MKIAYLIDHDSVGGGMEYVRRQMAAHLDDETHEEFLPLLSIGRQELEAGA